MSRNSRYWGNTGWVDGKPVIRLGHGASYGTLVEELHHVQQIQNLRLDYFREFGKMPKGDVLDSIIKNRGLEAIWESEAHEILKKLGFERLIIRE